MTTLACLHCRATTTNGLALCDLCQRFARDCLANLPVYFRNLARQRRPGRPNGSVGAGGRANGGSVSVVAALGRAENDIATYARMLVDDRGIKLPEADTEVEMFAALCLTFEVLLTTIATLEWAGEFVRDLKRIGSTLHQVSQSSLPGWYAGRCKQVRTMEGDHCGTDLYVLPGLTWLTCPTCGATTHAADHLETILEEAADWKARPKALAEAIVALVDGEQSVPQVHDRIRQWSSRDQIRSYRSVDEDGDEVGPKRYRLGDVLDLMKRDRDARARAAEQVAAEAS